MPYATDNVVRDWCVGVSTIDSSWTTDLHPASQTWDVHAPWPPAPRKCQVKQQRNNISRGQLTLSWAAMVMNDAHSCHVTQLLKDPCMCVPSWSLGGSVAPTPITHFNVGSYTMQTPNWEHRPVFPSALQQAQLKWTRTNGLCLQRWNRVPNPNLGWPGACKSRTAAVLERTWPDSQTSRPRADKRMPCAFRTGKYGKNAWTGKSRESRRTETAKEGWDMRRVKARWRETDTFANTFLQTLEPCVYVHTHEDVRMCADTLCNRQMCVQQVSVCTPSPSYTLLLHVYETLKNSVKKILSRKTNIHHSMTILTKNYSIRRLGSEPFKILRLHHSMSVLFFLTGTCSISWLFINHCEWRLLGFLRHASLRDRPS